MPVPAVQHGLAQAQRWLPPRFARVDLDAACSLLPSLTLDPHHPLLGRYKRQVIKRPHKHGGEEGHRSISLFQIRCRTVHVTATGMVNACPDCVTASQGS